MPVLPSPDEVRAARVPTRTNAPTYAPHRRPGEPTDLVRAGEELVILATTLDDALILAALLEAGAAAHERAPVVGSYELVRRRRECAIGYAAAQALAAERDRIRSRNEENRS